MKRINSSYLFSTDKRVQSIQERKLDYLEKTKSVQEEYKYKTDRRGIV